MMHAALRFPPGSYVRVNTVAGLSLTEADYQRAGVQGLVYSLTRMLMRPGLTHWAAWRSAAAWQGPVFLDASDLVIGADQTIRLRSDYDGSLIQHTVAALCSAIAPLQLDALIWPSAENLPLLRQSLSAELAIFYPTASGSYICSAQGAGDSPPLVLLSEREALRTYPPGSLMVSDTAVADAVAGILYDVKSTYAICDSAWQCDQQPLAPGCSCPACAGGRTRSYFHHLFAQTPLLCHRWLAMHNLRMALRG
ncbi:MAG: hypothetical protein JJT82_06220 [Legionellaceae bacterium]|nr:hypothetical protein [Legionellaceae bacterium]